jgi:hypothetical protein
MSTLYQSYLAMSNTEELDGPAVSVLRRAIAEDKQRWLFIGWVTKNLLSRGPPCSGRHVYFIFILFILVRQLVQAAFIVVSNHQSALGLLSLCVIHKEGTVHQQWGY